MTSVKEYLETVKLYKDNSREKRSVITAKAKPFFYLDLVSARFAFSVTFILGMLCLFLSAVYFPMVLISVPLFFLSGASRATIDMINEYMKLNNDVGETESDNKHGKKNSSKRDKRSK